MAVAGPLIGQARGFGATAVAASEDRPGDDRQTHVEFSRDTTPDATPIPPPLGGPVGNRILYPTG
jgi:hypothetical protein